MEKLKKILKLPALVVSCAIFLAFMITLIVICTKDCSTFGTYVYEKNYDGEKVRIVIELDDDGEGEYTETYYSIGEISEEKYEFYYKVVDGRLYSAEIEPILDYEYTAEIDAFEVGVGNMVAKNKSAIALKVCSIVFMCLFGVGAIASGAYIYLSKKKENKVETVESAQEEPERE